ncbi:MAG: hypothetical protein JSS89_01460 [Bacteroidetes bacterium]|nr:hypothetical protein [Bacteroidota bacterium]
MKTQLMVILLVTMGSMSCNVQNGASGRDTIVTEIPRQTSSLPGSELNELDSVDIDFQFYGDCYAYSSDKNAVASNGESHSDNLPRKVDRSFPRKGLYMVINENERCPIDSTLLGCKLYLVNTTDSLVKMEASDSRLYIVAEALDGRNVWSPISYLPSSFCGNSYHTVALDKDEYWSFDIPVFKGTIKTKLRYTLTIDKRRKISSNEVVAYLNKGQFNVGHVHEYRSNNIMDPYQNR